MEQLVCDWEPAKFLILSNNVFDSLIYYSHLLPLVVSLALGIFVFLSDRKALINKVFLSLASAFSLWVFFDLILWADEKPELVMFFWSIIVPVEFLIYSAALYLLYLYIDKKDISLRYKLILSVFFLPILLFTHTSFNLIGFDYSNCDRAAVEGPLIQYLYYIELIIVVWAVVKSIKGILAAKSMEEKRQIAIFSLGIVIFLVMFSIGNLVISWSENWRFEQYKLFGMPIFIALLTYLIVQFKAFNIKLLATQALVVGLVILIASEFFFVRNPVNIVLTGITLIIAIGFGYILVRSVKGEVAQRERIERLAGDIARANDSLFAANLKLKELDRQKTEFVSIASHQLRSPLTAIKGYTSMILEGSYGEVGEKMHQPLQNIFDSSQRLVVVIEDFLNITRIELGRMKYDFSNLNIKDLAEKVVSTLKVPAEQKGLTLNFVAEGGEYVITADSGKISQVISNLVDNAIKYTPTGSIEVKVSDGEGKVRIAIKDSGVGLTPEMMPKLFEKFVRADDAGKVNYSGTGLGLYVAKQMVEAHKGTIWAESEGVGKGSTFIVELPVKKG